MARLGLCSGTSVAPSGRVQPWVTGEVLRRAEGGRGPTAVEQLPQFSLWPCSPYFLSGESAHCSCSLSPASLFSSTFSHYSPLEGEEDLVAGCLCLHLGRVSENPPASSGPSQDREMSHLHSFPCFWFGSYYIRLCLFLSLLAFGNFGGGWGRRLAFCYYFLTQKLIIRGRKNHDSISIPHLNSEIFIFI